MFYSHEVLTSRKYGVATVWLVATLGAKSMLKRVSRKAILDVDVARACQTIVTPEAPMALRLQSNLLYGVTRVYSQQCGYVLTDAETARNNIRALFSVVRTAALEPEGGTKGKSDQLVLQDDPTFMLELDDMPEGITSLDFDTAMLEESQVLSLTSRRSSEGQHSMSGLMIPPSDSSIVGGAIGGLDLFGGRESSLLGRANEPARLLDDEDLGLDIGMDEDVVMSRETHRHARGPREPVDRLGPEQNRRSEDVPDEGPLPGEEVDITADPFSYDPDYAHPAARASTPDTAQATIRKKHRQPPKIIPLDYTMEIHNSELSRWNTDYVQRMKEASQHRAVIRSNNAAKKNAEFWVLGPSDGISDPLDIFSGAKIIETFTGINPRQVGQKRVHDADEHGQRKRHRSEQPSDEVGRGNVFDEDILMHDDTIEMGRDAPTPLDERRASSMLPWNMSAGSRRPTEASASAGGPYGSALDRRGSRLVSASPLRARGAAAPGSDRSDRPLPMPDTFLSGGIDSDFELFGPAAQVDTQTAEQSQWQRSTLVGESANFLSFVQNAIDAADANRAIAAAGDEEDESLDGSVTFTELLPPETNSRVVAAQAFLHVLALGTRSLLKVRQDEDYGPIELRVVA